MIQVYIMGNRAKLIDPPGELVAMLKRVNCLAVDGTIETRIIPDLQKLWTITVKEAPRPKAPRAPDGMYLKLRELFNRVDQGRLTSEERSMFNGLLAFATERNALSPYQYHVLQDLGTYPQYQLAEFIAGINSSRYKHLITEWEWDDYKKIRVRPHPRHGLTLFRIYTKLKEQEDMDRKEFEKPKPKLYHDDAYYGGKTRLERLRELEAKQKVG